MYVATNPMLRTEEGNQIYVRCFMQNVNGGFHLIIHSGGVGNQTYAFAFQTLEVLVFQDFDACLYPNLLCLRCTTEDAEDTEENVFLHDL